MKRIIAYITLVLASLLTLLPVSAIAPIERDGSVSIAAGANTVYLDGVGGTKGSYSHVIIWTLAGSDSINVTFNQGATASSSNTTIPAGAGLAYGLVANSPSTNQVNYYDASSGSGTLCWMAW
jgi:hypothetical protein